MVNGVVNREKRDVGGAVPYGKTVYTFISDKMALFYFIIL